MGILNKLINVFSDKYTSNIEFESVINETRKEYAKNHSYFWDIKVSETSVYNDVVKNWEDKKRIAFVLFLIGEIHNYGKGKRSWASGDIENQKNSVKQGYVHHLFRAKLVMDDEDIRLLYEAFSRNKKADWAVLTSWPIASMLNQIEKQRKDDELSEELKSVLSQIKSDINSINVNYDQKERIKLVEKIDAIIFRAENDQDAVKPTKFLGDDEFATYANSYVNNLTDLDKKFWYRLITLAQKATGSKPTKKYLDETKNIFKELGTDKFKKVVNDWFLFIINLKEKEEQHSYTYQNEVYTASTYEFITTVNCDAIKGFIWICSHFHDNTTIHNIAALAERSFKKIPGKGPAAAAIGNACLFVLYKSRGLDGVGQLSRLKLRIKQSSTQALIEKYLQAAADEQGVSVHEIEDLAVDDYGLINGSIIVPFDDYKAELTIVGVGKTELKWYKPDGTLQKSDPAFVKEKYKLKHKKLKSAIKQIEQTVSAQRDRFDRMFRSDRKINWNNFEEQFLNHGLLSFLTKRIIWEFKNNDSTISAIWKDNQWINSKNETVELSDILTVSLWHPATASVAQIKEWRDFLIEHQLQQPLKQAFREVYLLTEAEVNTRVYSNRMAAHVLKQHQFNSLAKTRGWKYALMGAFDNGQFNSAAELKLPEYNLRAEYWINEVNADDAFNDTGIWNYVSTDQVRFVNTETNEIVELADIPPIPFSEILRDVDLFVGVASVGNDPTWRDSGGIPAYRDYWQSYSFGELSEVAKMRKDILINLVPRLKINKVVEIKDKFLIVKGKLRTYKIHIGSTNILMEPNDQYLCIVPDRSQKNHTENLFLPFEGDTGLSIILSKAFLLADDDKITDKTITSQINRN